MLKAAKISFNTAKKNIFIFGIINGLVFIFLLLSFKYLNLLHVFGLSLINFVVLFFISMIQFKQQIKKANGYIPFLQVFCTTLFTGSWAFMVFAVFMFVYSFFDPYAAELFIGDGGGSGKIIPFILVFFQGSGGSVIVALAISFYTARYEDGEANI